MILIPFSSGLDSTSLVYDAIQKKKDFELCYIEILNNTTKTDIEKQQREKIKKLFTKLYGKWFSDKEGFQLRVGRNEMITMPQVPVWICGLLYSITDCTKEVQIGYCMNDDAISFLSDIKKTWNSYNAFSQKPLPKITFPLIKNKKQESYRTLPNEIFQETFFCEDPRNVKLKDDSSGEYSWEDCGHCAACERSKYEGIFYNYIRNQKKEESGLLFTPKPLEEIKSEEPFVELEASEQDFTRIEEK
jgi:7-cyano-7-deazaguanine synthase in queuosine biosynthesis